MRTPRPGPDQGPPGPRAGADRPASPRPGPRLDGDGPGARSRIGAGRRPRRARTERSRRVRRRIDTVVLRFQGRFDTDWSDRVLPWLCAAGLVVVLTLLASARTRSLETTVDFAASVQATWLIHHGLPPIVTVTTGQHVLAPQVALVLYPISGLAYALPIGPALVLLQSGALALAVIPIWLLCRRLANLRVGTSVCVIAAYALFPAVHSINLAGFHPETMALPALLYAAYSGLSSRWRRFGVCCLFVLLCRADLGLAVAGLGALVWANGRRVEGRVAVVVGILYTLVAALVLEPRLGGGVYPHIGAHLTFGETPGAVVWGMLTRPVTVVGVLLREQNFDLVGRLLAPVVFLPLLAPRYLLPVLPLELLYLTSDTPGATVYGDQSVAVIAFVFLATAFALGTVGRAGPDRVRVERWVLVVLLVASVVAFGREGVSSPYRRPWGWGGIDQVDNARLEARKLVGGDRSVRASDSLATVLAERPRVYRLAVTADPDPAAAAEGVDAVVLDGTTVPTWTEAAHATFRAGLETRGFRRESAREGIEVYVRGGR
jgi:uncharacterized membrane protein